MGLSKQEIEFNKNDNENNNTNSNSNSYKQIVHSKDQLN